MIPPHSGHGQNQISSSRSSAHGVSPLARASRPARAGPRGRGPAGAASHRPAARDYRRSTRQCLDQVRDLAAPLRLRQVRHRRAPRLPATNSASVARGHTLVTDATAESLIEASSAASPVEPRFESIRPPIGCRAPSGPGTRAGGIARSADTTVCSVGWWVVRGDRRRGQ